MEIYELVEASADDCMVDEDEEDGASAGAGAGAGARAGAGAGAAAVAGVVVGAEAGGASPDGGGALDFASLFPEDFAPPENRNKMVVHTFYINKIE